MTKTNAMRMLDAAKIKYEIMEYVPDENDLTGTHIAAQIGLDENIVFKTLVAVGDKTGHIVFCIPSPAEIDLKKAAAATGNKKIEMVHVKELFALTGYVRGGCSPLGMKKQYPTVFHETVQILDTVMVSAGKIGYQVELAPAGLLELAGAEWADLCVEG